MSQNAKQVVLVGTFSAGPQDIRIEDGQLRIVKDGQLRKFVAEVEQRTFAGRLAAERGQPVLYVTERCVLRLTLDGLELIEIAPGVDIQRDILARMDFTPIVREPRLMDARLFLPACIGLGERLAAD
jgi:propionate CoA-transferase